jgi:hypothetical protein
MEGSVGWTDKMVIAQMAQMDGWWMNMMKFVCIFALNEKYVIYK